MKHRAVRYDDIYRIDKIKTLSFHIMFYRLFDGVAKYIEIENAYVKVDILDPVFCRLVPPCKILLPPIKTVGKS